MHPRSKIPGCAYVFVVFIVSQYPLPCGINKRATISKVQLDKIQIRLLASCLIYARALLEYVIIVMWLRSVIKMSRSVKFVEDKVLTLFIFREKC